MKIENREGTSERAGKIGIEKPQERRLCGNNMRKIIPQFSFRIAPINSLSLCSFRSLVLFITHIEINSRVDF
jgi:hypothetical protein